MKKIEIIPLVGIKIENIGQINLGQSKAEIENLLGKPSKNLNDKKYFYDDFEFRVDFDKKGKSGFIEFIYGPFPEKTEISIYDVNPFRAGAKQLIKILTEKNNGHINDSEAEYCYCFLEISVGVWREFTEEDVQASMDEMKESGEFEENKEVLFEDLEKAKNFWTIGIGTKDYYNF